MPNHKIMIVEDEEIVAADIQTSIEKMGYAVCAMASSGMEAIKKAGLTRPDLILMDIVLKGSMDGIEAATRIKELYKIPVIYLTAFGDDSILQRAKVAEPYGYITKPFSQRELQIAIEISIYKKQAEDRIRKMEFWLATVLKSIGDAVIASDKERRITFMNAVAEKLTGWNHEDALGKNLTEILNIKDRDLLDLEKHLVEKVITEGLIINLIEDRLLIAKDGSELPISDSAAPIKDDNNESPGSVIVFRDITKNKQLEENLRTHQVELEMQNTELLRRKEELDIARARYFDLYDLAPVGYCTVSEDEFILEANLTVATLLGLPRGALIKKRFSKFILQEDHDIYYLNRKQLMATGEPQACELRIVKKAGPAFWGHLVMTTTKDAEGKPVCRVVLSDISELKQTNELFSLFMRHSPVYTYFKEVTSTQSLVLQASDNFAQMTGIPSTEMIGKTMTELFSPEFAAKITAEDWAVVSGREVLRLEEELNGRIFDTIKFPIVRGDKTLLAGYTVDITDRKRANDEQRSLEERLQRAEKMEALGQLAGGVAHDLNNVLGILSGYSELLLEEIPEESRSRGHVQKILQSTQKGAAIIQDLLTLARRGVTASEVLNLNSIVSDFLGTPVFDKFKNDYPRVTFRTECDNNLLNIKGSPIHLEKTVMNLVSNAAEAITETGEVTIRTENRHLDKPIQGYGEIREGDYAVLIVSDTGMGIPAESIGKIFEPFYTKKKMGRSGTGLGLAIAWGTAKDHNGYIDVKTEVGKGTTFTLYFPVTRDELTSPEPEVPIEQYMGQGESVLVVDDIAEQGEIAIKLLTRLGYEVYLVSSGEEAVEYLKGNKVDILVLDMIMTPGIDGLETFRRILEINPRQKAIIVSGFSETERVGEAQKLGAGAYVKKPYVLEKIGVAIRDELNRK